MVFLVKNAESDASRRFFVNVKDTVSTGSSGNIEHVAIDCEGVNLSRIGSLELISICFSLSKDVFLLDVGGKPDSTMVKALKDLLESSKVTKIIHDCKMDADALFHILGIKLQNIHDTSCFHHAIAGEQEKNLNHVLSYNGIRINAARDKSIYKTNPAFWAARPITKKMVDWATSDVDKLFDLASKQLESIGSTAAKAAAKEQSNRWASVREMKIATNLRVNRPGPFIGRGGINLHRLSKQTDTFTYQDHHGTWFVLYWNSASLNSVKRAMDN